MINTDAATKASREEILTILKSMTENAADYTFIFVGNVNTATLKPLVEKYLAVLPGKASQKANPKDVPSLDIAKGSATVVEKWKCRHRRLMWQSYPAPIYPIVCVTVLSRPLPDRS